MRGSAFTVLLILSCSAIAKEQLYRPPRLDTGQPDMARAEDRDTPTEPTEYFEAFALEFACHEANYSLVHILEGARERDRQEVR